MIPKLHKSRNGYIGTCDGSEVINMTGYHMWILGRIRDEVAKFSR